MGDDTGLLNGASRSRIGPLADAVRPLYRLLRQRITNAQFTPASTIDAKMKNDLPSGAYLPFVLMMIHRRLNDILHFFLCHCRCALEILSSPPFAPPDMC